MIMFTDALFVTTMLLAKSICLMQYFDKFDSCSYDLSSKRHIIVINFTSFYTVIMFRNS